ncbi:peptidase M23 [Thioclava sp. SK-1]|uniref:M23 family metallopeptidase n=1 Tax=Thioclava sp. SK-1 TaxID=1889770 RepID=UPI0008246FA0|nr:M23 family metallopeptidase [Thioclava sp. SK-1]OCX66086.1 peptidase M23 [Thioclava sp. SK-1]
MPRRLIDRANTALERFLPEQRLFLKSDNSTRFVRLRPLTQASVLATAGLLFSWSMISTSLLFFDSISSGSSAQQAELSQDAFERRLESLSQERDTRAEEAIDAQERFQLALEQVSQMQSKLLTSEEHRRELETGIHVIQTTLRRVMDERDLARATASDLQATSSDGATGNVARSEDLSQTMDMLAAALNTTAQERDAATQIAQDAQLDADRIALEKQLLEERNNEIFSTLEDAVTVSMTPLDKMFKSAGMNPDNILAQVRKGYSGTGGPLTAIALSTKSMADLSEDDRRAANILQKLDQMNMYRIAVDKLPFAMPVTSQFRYSSPFGYRWGRLHAGMDMAAPVGTPILAPADGVVTAAEWENGYGQVIKIQHEFGVSTVYGHLSKIRVKKGQKVSQGDRIGDMGNTGRSTGPHLHYEIRVGGKPINPMTFIKAAKNVF